MWMDHKFTADHERLLRDQVITDDQRIRPAPFSATSGMMLLDFPGILKRSRLVERTT